MYNGEWLIPLFVYDYCLMVNTAFVNNDKCLMANQAWGITPSGVNHSPFTVNH